MPKKKLTIQNCLYFFVILIIAGYLISIFVINLIGRFWPNYDIHSDIIIAKYMWQERSFFPEGWHFGNQIYTVATPAVAALFYGIVKDAYLAMALASCLMTVGIIGSYIWCLKPFVNIKSIILSLLILIGGTNIGFTAHEDWTGFQVFYTMASYYACYVIGIFITIGVYFRLANHIKVHTLATLCVLIYNLALGMQSLRELLVLNLPLCAIIVLDISLHHNAFQKNLLHKKESYLFAILTVIANISGVFVTKLLTLSGIINQTTILNNVGTDIWWNFKQAVRTFFQYVGLKQPNNFREALAIASVIFSVIVIVLALISILTEYVKTKKISPLGYIIIFFIISLVAVFCAGLFVISLRHIYFFCWYLLVASSFAMLMRGSYERYQPIFNIVKNSLMLCLIILSVFNYRYTFYISFQWAPDDNAQYTKIVEQLLTDNIHYLYSDWRTDKNSISSMAHDKILYGTLSFSGNPNDLWSQTDYLYHEDWFLPDNFENACIVLSDYTLYCLEAEFSKEYRTTLMDNLEYLYSFRIGDEMVHFYLGSEKIYTDMLQ